jgi:hypothetical protein
MTGFGVVAIPTQVSISGTTTVTLQGLYASIGQTQGSDVTWTFGVPGVPIFVYETSYQIAPPGFLGGAGNPVDRTTVRVPTATPGSSPGTVTLTRAIPKGMVVRFCVWFYADPDLMKPLPAEASCLMSTVP